jgi:hypothetical protein
MAATPAYAASPNVGMVQISTANTNKDGTTGTYGTLFTAGASGSRIDRITITSTGTTTAGMVRLFVNDGSNARLWLEVPIPAVTPSASTPGFSFSTPIEDFAIDTGWSIKCSTEIAETFNVFAFGGDF